ncbi:YigZ family protein [Corynebacterium sp. ZY180755]
MGNQTSYARPRAGVRFQHDLEIKRSKFLTFIKRATTEEQARELIAELKREYPDARHHCSAFILHVEGSNPIERSNDDGEPSGTAGTPMLDVLRGSGILDIVAVTVRYFGGIKLGAGGLVHAYSDSVSQALEVVETVTRSRKELYTVDLSHADAGRIEADMRARGIDVVDTAYGQQVTYTLAVDPGERAQLEDTVAVLTAGAAQVKEAGINWVE